jgi:hypothetical protein
VIRTDWRWVLCVSLTACASGPPPVDDPVLDIPASPQRRISRQDFADSWPFEPGAGTLACIGQAVVFRAQGVTYALNDQARARGYVSVDSIVVSQSKGPSRPLERVTQDERMQIFRASTEFTASPDESTCKQRLARARGLSADELSQVEAEGRERSWPPLTRPRRSTDAVLKAGAALCSR